MTSLLEKEPEPRYATVMETSGEECESWYYFIKWNGNEKNLKYLKEQIDQIEMYIVDDLSAFDIEIEHLVSAQTAKEMTKLEINSVQFHRKFDGVLKTINIGMKRKDSNERRIEKINEKLAYGQISDYVDEEDIDPEDLASGDESELEESDHESDEDLIPLPLGHDDDSLPREDGDKTPELESSDLLEATKGKKKKKKKKRN